MVAQPQPAAQWEEWLGQWEDYFAAALAWLNQPSSLVPPLPSTPQPAGRPPAHLQMRLRRAAAVKDEVLEQLQGMADRNAGFRPALPPPGLKFSLEI